MAIADVMKKIKDNNVKFVDFRFTDTTRQRTARQRACLSF